MNNAKTFGFFPLLVILSCGSVLHADVIQIDPQATVFFAIQTSGTISPVANYTQGAASWQTTTDPLQFDSASSLDSQGLGDPFLNALQNDLGAGWSFGFNTSTTIASDSFKVGTYDAQAPKPPTSNGDALSDAGFCSSNNCVGAELFFNYVPTGADPTADIHWIQVLLVNYATNGAVLPPTYMIDNSGNGAPYYDGPFAANSAGFLDLPFVAFPTVPRDFEALTLLVSGPLGSAPGEVTIYGGIQWGWSNELVTPEPTFDALLVSILLVSMRILGLGVKR